MVVCECVYDNVSVSHVSVSICVRVCECVNVSEYVCGMFMCVKYAICVLECVNVYVNMCLCICEC